MQAQVRYPWPHGDIDLIAEEDFSRVQLLSSSGGMADVSAWDEKLPNFELGDLRTAKLTISAWVSSVI